MSVEKFAQSFVKRLDDEYFKLVWESVSQSDKKLTASLVQFDLDFLVVKDGEVVLFKDSFSDGWCYDLLGEAAIELPLDIPDEVVHRLEDKLPGITIRKASSPVPTKLQERYGDRIQELISKAYKG